MLCYGDKTFCGYYFDCKDGAKCGRALTPNIQKQADNLRLPISQYAQKPKCFKEEK